RGEPCAGQRTGWLRDWYRRADAGRPVQLAIAFQPSGADNNSGRRLPGGLRGQVCRRLYKRPCHYGPVNTSMAFAGGDLLLHGGRAADDELAAAAYSFSLKKTAEI